MKLFQLFEMPVVGMKDSDVPADVKRDYRRVLMRLATDQTDKFEPVEYGEAGEVKRTQYYLQSMGDDLTVTVNLLDPDELNDPWTVEITYSLANYDRLRSKALMRKWEGEFHNLTKVYDVRGGPDGGSFRVALPFTKG